MNNFNPNHLKQKAILAIDYGTKNIGLAISHAANILPPIPYKVIKNTGDNSFIEELQTIIDEESIEILLFGLPLNSQGEDGSLGPTIRKLVNKIENLMPDIPIYLQDETLSTYEAETRLQDMPYKVFKKNQKNIDALAATIILEDFLNQLA